MNTYLISYDLNKNKDYKTLLDALRKQGFTQVMKSVWIYEGQETAVQIGEWINKMLDNDDSLIVTQITKSNTGLKNVNLVAQELLMKG